MSGSPSPSFPPPRAPLQIEEARGSDAKCKFPAVFCPSSNVRQLLSYHVSRSSMAPHGARVNAEGHHDRSRYDQPRLSIASEDSAPRLLRVTRSAANARIFAATDLQPLSSSARRRESIRRRSSGASPSGRNSTSATNAPNSNHADYYGYSSPYQSVGVPEDRYRRIEDLAAELMLNSEAADTYAWGTSRARGAVDAEELPAVTTQHVNLDTADPRAALQEKAIEILEKKRPSVPKHVQKSLDKYSRSMALIKPYMLIRSARLSTVAAPIGEPVNTMDAYVEKVQTSRPSKGLYSYY